MATVLYLNDIQVFPDGRQTIKLTKENPYFTRSDSYTLDVTLPMDIFENSVFFKNIHRIEHNKTVLNMTCRLFSENKLLLSGAAKVTQVTEKEVKVQLLGGNSEIKLLSEDNNIYIDELSLPRDYSYGLGDGIFCIGLQAYDETYDRIANRRSSTEHYPFVDFATGGMALQPNLIGTMLSVMKACGYVCYISVNKEPWSSLYIASAKQTDNVAHALPHWKVKEFVDEFCKFFNCTLVIDQIDKTARFVDNKDFFGTQREISIEPIDEYTVEMNEDDNTVALANNNIEFDMSSSPSHDYDVIPDNVRESAPKKTYNSRSEALDAYNSMAEEERLKYIFECPEGRFAGWKQDYSDMGESGEKVVFTQIDVFGPLIKDAGNENTVSLKICPVAITEEATAVTFYFVSGGIGELACRSMALENPTGNEKFGTWLDGDDGSGQEEPATIQEYVEGGQKIEKKEKEDRMQVFFHDYVEQTAIEINPKHGDWPEEPKFYMPFTDWRYKSNHKGAAHKPWSLSLNKTEAAFYLGQLHEDNFSFNTKAKICIRFISEEIPDPTRIFIIRNKRYGCEKIEVNVDSNGIDRLMTGYFYEML